MLFSDWIPLVAEDIRNIFNAADQREAACLGTRDTAERINIDLRRRTRVASISFNGESLLRLASALLFEIDDEWKSKRIYLTMTTIGGDL
ncbi:MAG: transposase [Planctomycetota bacterium]